MKRHVLFIGWSPASCIIDRRKREREGSTKEGREERKGRERKKGERRGRKGREHSFLLPFGLSLMQLKSEIVSDS